jgi:hypothetical protein
MPGKLAFFEQCFYFIIISPNEFYGLSLALSRLVSFVPVCGFDI